MSWNYRLTVQRVPQADGSTETTYAIREAYYDEHGKLNGWTESPVYPSGETWEEFQKDFAHYQRASLYPKSEIIDVTVGEPSREPGAGTSKGRG